MLLQGRIAVCLQPVASVQNRTVDRYRRELTHSDQQLAKLADEARKLRQEIQSMVKHRRRSDVRSQSPDLSLLKSKKPR